MEEKLSAYRRQQKRQVFFETLKIRWRNMINPPKRADDVKITVDVARDGPGRADDQNSAIALEDGDSDVSQEEEEQSQTSPQIDKNWRYTLVVLYFIFWATCFALAVEFQFGAVFLVISALVGIYMNTRTGPKPKNEMSAYSVFNKNVESIDGTLKAEQFEREIRYGSMSVR